MSSSALHMNGISRIDLSSRSNRNRSSLSYRPIMVNMEGSRSYWASIQADIEAHLKQAIPVREPLSVFEPMHHLVFTAPRNAAPALCVAACELVGGRRDQAMAAASALQLMHAASFIHEHLPLKNRPQKEPTVQHLYGPNIELLIADGLIPFGFELLARSDKQDISGRVLRAVAEIARATGSEGMISGQYRKVLYDESDCEEVSHVEVIERVCERREGALHACGAACGAILGGGSEEDVDRLRKYGLYVGMVQGISQWGEEKGEGLAGEKEVQELKNLAIKELEGFKHRNLEAISSFLN